MCHHQLKNDVSMSHPSFQVRHETRVGSHYGINFLRKTCCIRLKRKCNVHGMYTVFEKCLGRLECLFPLQIESKSEVLLMKISFHSYVERFSIECRK